MIKVKIKVGDWVWFEIPGVRIFGIVEKLNRKTATVFRKFSSGYSKRKSFEKLRMWDISQDKLTVVNSEELSVVKSMLEASPSPRLYKKKERNKVIA